MAMVRINAIIEFLNLILNLILALFTVSRDKSFASVDVETGKLLFQKEKAHG
jgi:hypothetical protein